MQFMQAEFGADFTPAKSTDERKIALRHASAGEIFSLAEQCRALRAP
jgi:hypothetical protein